MDNIVLWTAAISLILVVGLRRLSLHRLVSNTKKISLESMYLEVEGSLEKQVFLDVITALGESYSVEPGVLRPKQTLSSLEEFDGWDLGSGSEKMNKWLNHEGISEFQVEPKSIFDLMLIVQEHRRQQCNQPTI